VNTPATDESRPLLDSKYSSKATANHGLMPALSMIVPGRPLLGLLLVCLCVLGHTGKKQYQNNQKKLCGLVGYCVGGECV
jgi:hypothetical protein